MPSNIISSPEILDKIFHEPNRLAIISTLCASDSPLSFNEIREACNLTDGNLSRHLKVMEEAGVLAIDKSFIGSKPRTTVSVTPEGLAKFNDYLSALGEILAKAKKAMKTEKKHDAAIYAKTARA